MSFVLQTSPITLNLAPSYKSASCRVSSNDWIGRMDTESNQSSVPFDASSSSETGPASKKYSAVYHFFKWYHNQYICTVRRCTEWYFERTASTSTMGKHMDNSIPRYMPCILRIGIKGGDNHRVRLLVNNATFREVIFYRMWKQW
jgi:hypothetical protein